MSGLLRNVLFISDFIILNLALLLSILIIAPELLNTFDSGNVYLITFSNLSWLFLVLVSNPNHVSKGWSITKIVKSQLAFIFIHLLVTISLVFFFDQRYPVVLFVLIYSFFFVAYFLIRVLIFYLHNVLTDELQKKNFVLIGRNQLSEDIRKYYLRNLNEGYNFLGYVEAGSGSAIFDAISVISERSDIHEIFCCTTEISEKELEDLVQFGLNSLIKVKILIRPTDDNMSIRWTEYDRVPGIDLSTIDLDDKRNRFLKRSFDILFSFLFCAFILSWLTPLIAMLIKLDSSGPVFFRQLRSGEGNKPFLCWKFRTMKINQESDIKQAAQNDDRITRLGSFLRKSSIDELPQFFNVLSGTMSVVGPRPHMLKHTEEYSKLIERFMTRHYVKPGITGLAQCLGYRGETKTLADMENRVRLDRYYIENWSFWLDIRIIFLTVISLIRGSDKAY
jgi:putative colanic acid biosysnthesis UDP-glucose lipid carrier transferase